MLVRLLYASRASDAVEADAVSAILRVSRSHNPAAGITGVLCFCADARVFLQVLEGGRLEVSTLYNRIAVDTRHRDVMLLACHEIDERRFAGWSMGQVDMNRLNPAVLLRYFDRAVLDPFSMSGKASLALLDEMVATAAIGTAH